MKKQCWAIVWLTIIVSSIGISLLTAGTPDLTGVWKSSSDGVYYLRQIDNNLWWYGEAALEHPTWANVACGRIQGDIIELNWSDVPKGEVQSYGILVVKIESANHLVVIKQTGGFGDSEWSKEEISESEE